jgi:alpha-L-fucosidase
MIKAFSIKISCFLFVILYGCNRSPVKNEIGTSPGKSPDKEQRLEWFKEAKFGMFIHWGPYSRLAGEWNGKQVPVGKNAEWIMKELKIPVDEYRELAHKFNPVRFDAKKWVRLAKTAGMKYIVITAKHHDGFAMYKSDVTSYDIVDWTPFKRDPLKELSEACKEEGIKFCVYYSHREDWDHPGGYGNNWDYDNDWGSSFYDKETFEKYLEEKAKPQLRELLTGYGPIGLVWFDRGMYNPEQALEFIDLIRNLQPSTLINGRVGNYDQEFLGDYQSMGDNGMPTGGLDEYWETPITLNRTWGFSKFDTLWKSPEAVILQFVAAVSRGGNYLLNIGPKGDGEIPEVIFGIFEKVGSWVERNAESIYGTSVNPFGELPWGFCTVKENKLYLFVRDWPVDKELDLPGLQKTVISASLLTDQSVKLRVRQAEGKTSIELPSVPPDQPLSVLVLETDGPPEVAPPAVIQEASGNLELNYLTAITHGGAMKRFNRKGGFHISKWTGPEDTVEWNINVKVPGVYKIITDYSANRESEGKSFELTVAGSHIEEQVNYTGDWFEYYKFPAGYVNINNPGEYKLTIHPKESGNSFLMHLRSITLEPAADIKKSGWSTK